MTSDETVTAIVKWLEARSLMWRQLKEKIPPMADAITYWQSECENIRVYLKRGDWRMEATDGKEQD